MSEYDTDGPITARSIDAHPHAPPVSRADMDRHTTIESRLADQMLALTASVDRLTSRVAALEDRIPRRGIERAVLMVACAVLVFIAIRADTTARQMVELLTRLLP